ncbi:histidine phosphatase superfamily [Lasiosphaeria miniovina]|uniref:Histidine phosphatase superfamily n=1 Tax=Lasiosphaeria miniovina TaxID=1954250 RepID=A0AA39ZYT6_9PEZI|nr:histidine phosphatase superfamily [Lasiosphaeria miniovina]KAK0705939.1 histidine phosphatase superfamily [Lasiosphaeria miniovina]
MAASAPRLKYTAVTGFFKHSDEPAIPSFESITLPGLGLIDRAYETDDTFDPRREKQPWERFVHYLGHLNSQGATADKAVAYKLIYAARHGEGYHNVMEAKVGTVEWEAHWARLDGDGTTTWSDASLTPTGISEARAIQVFWADAASSFKLPLAPRHYVSPLARCLETCELAFAGLTVPDTPVPPFKPIIKELVRERLGVHTCDRRRSRTWIAENYPLFAFEDGFAEADELWNPDVRETLEEHAARVEGFLDNLFANDRSDIVSLTAHSGTILALYFAIGHPEVRLAPGTVVPVLIKAEVVE